MRYDIGDYIRIIHKPTNRKILIKIINKLETRYLIKIVMVEGDERGIKIG